jgi:hypothetical protein
MENQALWKKLSGQQQCVQVCQANKSFLRENYLPMGYREPRKDFAVQRSYVNGGKKVSKLKQ